MVRVGGIFVARLSTVFILSSVTGVVMQVMVFLEQGCAASLALGMDVMHTVETFLSTIVV